MSNFKSRLKLTLVGLVLGSTTLLSACGGGGGASLSDIRDLTDSTAPIETPVDQGARAAAIISRADSLISSTIHGETTNPDFPAFRLFANCTGTYCAFRNPQTGYQYAVTLDDLSLAYRTPTISLSKNGITLFGTRSNDLDGYGSWMRHSSFHVLTESIVVENISVTGRHGIMTGDLTGTAPDTSASWRGVMVGTPIAGSDRGNFLQGDARLTYSFNTSSLAKMDARFTNIKNIDRNRAHSVTTVRFDDVPVYANGTFQAGITGNKIQGGFYGPAHVETAGVFEQGNIVGAFGARK